MPRLCGTISIRSIAIGALAPQGAANSESLRNRAKRPRKTPRERREKLDQDFAKLRDEDAKLKVEERKLDSHIKIVIGGGLLALAREKDDPEMAKKVLRRVLDIADERETENLAYLEVEFFGPTSTKSTPAGPPGKSADE